MGKYICDSVYDGPPQMTLVGNYEPRVVIGLALNYGENVYLPLTMVANMRNMI